MEHGLSEGLGNFLIYVQLDVDERHQLKMVGVDHNDAITYGIPRIRSGNVLNDHMFIINFLKLAEQKYIEYQSDMLPRGILTSSEML